MARCTCDSAHHLCWETHGQQSCSPQQCKRWVLDESERVAPLQSECIWNLHKGKVLSKLVSASKASNLSSAQAKCLGYGSSCSGVTCTLSGSCTLGMGRTLYNSRKGEVTYIPTVGACQPPPWTLYTFSRSNSLRNNNIAAVANVSKHSVLVESSGSVFSDWRDHRSVEDADATVGPLSANNTWVEVTRTNLHGYLEEGVDFYGCWFYAALGTGIWINTKRTVHVPSRFRASSMLAEQWLALHGLDPSSYKTNSFQVKLTAPAALKLVPPRALLPHVKEHFPFFAHALGYDTVQSMTDSSGFRELIVTSVECMQALHPLGTCAPPGIDTRAGWGASRSCTCVNESSGAFALNCDGTTLSHH